MTAQFTKTRHAFLSARDLHPHPLVQREFDGVKARALRDRFDPDKFGTLAVATDGATYFVWDGQHRLWAATEVLGPDQKLPCEVYENVPVERLADLFLGRNDTKPVRTLDKFKIAVLARRMPETRIVEIVEEMGMSVGHAYKVGVIRAPKALVSIFALGGEPLLRRTLRVARGAWGGDADALDGIILRALARVLHQFASEISDSDLANKLAKHGTPGRMIGAARDHAKTMGVNVERAAIERVVNVYNKGRRSRVVAEPSRATSAA